MQLTKPHLKQIIKEELEIILAEEARWKAENLKAYRLAQDRGDKTVQQQVAIDRNGEPVFDTVRVLPFKGRPERLGSDRGSRRTPEPTPRPKRKPRQRPPSLGQIARECEGFTCPMCWMQHYDDVYIKIMCALKRSVSYEEIRYYIENPDAARQLNFLNAWDERRVLEKLEQLNIKVFYNELSDACKKKLKVWTEKQIHRGRRPSRFWCGRKVLPKREPEIFEEVYSKKQRRWACSNPHELTAAQAREMCGSKKLKKKKRKSKK